MTTDAEKARWYDEIAPRLTNFGNDLPEGVVARAVTVLNLLREWTRENAANPEAISEGVISPDDMSCFLMCVDQFWERGRNADVLKRLSDHA